jgi:hypothetical protein
MSQRELYLCGNTTPSFCRRRRRQTAFLCGGVLEKQGDPDRAAPRSPDHTTKPRTPIATKSAVVAKIPQVSTAINRRVRYAGVLASEVQKYVRP